MAWETSVDFGTGLLSGSRSLSRNDLLRRAAQAATGLGTLGVREDDTIALILRNDFAFFEASFAAEILGAFAVPVNWHFTGSEAGYIVRDCGAKAIIAHADLLPALRPHLPAGVPLLCVKTPPEIAAAYGLVPKNPPISEGVHNWDRWLEQFDPLLDASTRPRIAVIYTSGTTGRPKGVRRQPATPAMAQAVADMVKTCFGFGPHAGFRTVITGPLYHSAPNLYGLTAARNGGLVILQPRFDAEQLLALVERHRITHVHLVPTMMSRLLKLDSSVREKCDLSSLQFATHAAAPCPPEVKRDMIDWWGPIINEYYGSTETGAVVFHTSQEAVRKPGTVGRPIERGIVRIFDSEGRNLPAGEIGEIYMKIRDYPDFIYIHRNEDRWRIERDGLITAGDIGYLDKDDYLFLCDRANDMVISAGVNIYPAEIEAAIVTHPKIADCAVFGIPDPEYGEALAAYIQLQPGEELPADALYAYLADRLARFKHPKLVKFVDVLEREDSGKLFKRKLRAPYWEEAGRSI